MAVMAPEALAAAGASRSSSGGPGGTASKAGLLLGGLFLLPVLAVSTVLLLLAGVGAAATPSSLGCAGSDVAGTALDGEQMVNARTIVTVTAGRGLPVLAAVIAVATSYTEAGLHNSTEQSDHDSEGLFQQRVSIYTKAVADDPVRATNAFLDRLIGVPDWQTRDPGSAAQAVQASAYPDRYATHVSLAEQLVGQLWPTTSTTNLVSEAAGAPGTGGSASDVTASSGPTPTAAAAEPTGAPTTAAPTSSAAPTTASAVAVACTGGGNPGAPVGGTGNNVAGQTALPAGFTVTGSPAGQAAVRYALAQLGEPYVYGAAGPDAWDCSGLTMAAWAAQGVPLAHFTGTQAHQGSPLPLDPAVAAGGDLVLIPGSDGTPAVPGHVGMIAGTSPGPGGRTETWIVQAPMTGIPVELTDATQWAGQIVAIRHIG